MRRHPVDAVALVFGVITALALAGWALWWTDAIPGEAYSWLVPAALVVAGGAGIAASLRSPAPDQPPAQMADLSAEAGPDETLDETLDQPIEQPAEPRTEPPPA